MMNKHLIGDCHDCMQLIKHAENIRNKHNDELQWTATCFA